MESLSPHLDEVCLAARSAPITGFEGVMAVWIGSSMVHVPANSGWSAGTQTVNIIRDAWWQFWTKPFRVIENRDGRHLVFWQAARLHLAAGDSGHGNTSSGVRMYRENAHGQSVQEDIRVPLDVLMRGILGSKSRSLMEAGMRRCLRAQLLLRGLPPAVPPTLLDALAFRIETQLDARMDWRSASDELLQLALGGGRVVRLHALVSPGRTRGQGWQRPLFALRAQVAAWPAGERAYLPFIVPMYQQGVVAQTPADVVHWLHGIGVSRRALSRLHRVPMSVSARMASLMLDVRPAALPAIAAATNRFLAVLHACHADSNFPRISETNMVQAVALLALDAVNAIGRLPRASDSWLTTRSEQPEEDKLPWAVSGRVEYAEQRGFRPSARAEAIRADRERRHRQPDEQQFPAPFGENSNLVAGANSRVLGDARGLLQQRWRDADGRAVQQLAALLMRQYLGGHHRDDRQGDLVIDVFDWFNHAEPLPGVAQLQGNWVDILRRQQAWHEERRRRAPAVPAVDVPYQQDYSWPEWVQPLAVAPWRAIQFTDSAGLREEGKILLHCVGSYDKRCRSGESVIFSIRKVDSEERLGTAQFRRSTSSSGSAWALVQFRGYRNRSLPDSDVAEPKALARLIADIAAKLDQVDFRQPRAANG